MVALAFLGAYLLARELGAGSWGGLAAGAAFAYAPWKLEPCRTLTWMEEGERQWKRDQDLRDTAVTWLARAGCTLPEIASITGHSLRSIHQILQHYLAITPELADSAIAKLVAWMEKEHLVV